MIEGEGVLIREVTSVSPKTMFVYIHSTREIRLERFRCISHSISHFLCVHTHTYICNDVHVHVHKEHKICRGAL